MAPYRQQNPFPRTWDKPRENVELDTDNETSSLMQNLVPPASKFTRSATKTCANVLLEKISDEIEEIEPEEGREKKGFIDKLLVEYVSL